MFSRAFQDQLRLGKYTSWVNGHSEDSLGGLFWMVGEYGVRAHRALEILQEHYDQLEEPDPAFVRVLTALKTIESMVLGEQIGIEDARDRIRQTTQREHDRGKN